MKTEKTFRDFYNEVITEAENKNQSQAHSSTFKKLMQKKEDNTNYREIIKRYVDAFILTQGDDIYENFLEDVFGPPATTPGTSIPEVSKYEFIIDFFNYYYNVIFERSLGNVVNALNEASESIDIDEKEISRTAVKKVFNFIGVDSSFRITQSVNRAMRALGIKKQNRATLVKVYDALMGGY